MINCYEVQEVLALIDFCTAEGNEHSNNFEKEWLQESAHKHLICATKKCLSIRIFNGCAPCPLCLIRTPSGWKR
jgi:hypothetical protein